MKKWPLWILVFVIILAGLYQIAPYHIKVASKLWFANIDDYKEFPNDTLRTSTPKPWVKANNYNLKNLSEEQLQFFRDRETKAFIVVQNGELVFEQYWDEFGADTISGSFSMAKSVISLLIGKAIEEQYIKSVDQHVSEFLPEYLFVKGREVTIKDLLTMSAGFDWSEMYINPFTLTTEAYYGNDLNATLAKLGMKDEPGKVWNYQSVSTQVLGNILVKATGKSVTQYATEKLWQPLHMEQQALWSTDHANGMEKAFCCLSATARDYAKLGQLVLQGGRWDSTQVIPAAYIKEATSPATYLLNKKNQPVNHYGYQFWIMHHKNLTIPYFCGIIGQFIFVIPEKNAVIVRLGANVANSLDDNEQYTDGFEYVDAGLSILE
jgi:CubicO group peptidase (beta-lactamase class C family)